MAVTCTLLLTAFTEEMPDPPKYSKLSRKLKNQSRVSSFTEVLFKQHLHYIFYCVAVLSSYITHSET